MECNALYPIQGYDLMPSTLNQKVVEVHILTKSLFRPTEIVADLRNVAETLYHPLKLAGFWDERTSAHLCIDENKGGICRHRTGEGAFSIELYLQDDRPLARHTMIVKFPHAGIWIFLR